MCLGSFTVLFKSGGELLSHVLRRSTIAAAALNFRVREGIGCFARAMTTRPKKDRITSVLDFSDCSLSTLEV